MHEAALQVLKVVQQVFAHEVVLDDLSHELASGRGVAGSKSGSPKICLRAKCTMQRAVGVLVDG